MFRMLRNRKPEDSSPQDDSPPPSYEETMRTMRGGHGLPGNMPQFEQCPIPREHLGYHPVQIVCPTCQVSVVTVTSSSPSMMAWGMSTILCFTMLWPCFCLPLVMDSMTNVKHSCPHCKKVLGRFNGFEMWILTVLSIKQSTQGGAELGEA